MSIAVLFTASCVSVVFVAFYFVAGRQPRYQSHNLTYHDDDGEASPDTSAASAKAYASRLLPPILALGALSLAIVQWVLEDFDTRLGIIASGWVCSANPSSITSNMVIDHRQCRRHHTCS